MDFELDCDEQEGLVFIDETNLKELNSDLLYEMDILLDVSGQTELTFDFPDEKWEKVWKRETRAIREFCNSGKMLVWLLNNKNANCKIELTNTEDKLPKRLHLPSGKLLVITAGELIECLSYPELEMETLLESDIDAGWYAVSSGSIKHITFCKTKAPNDSCNNIEMIK